MKNIRGLRFCQQNMANTGLQNSHFSATGKLIIYRLLNIRCQPNNNILKAKWHFRCQVSPWQQQIYFQVYKNLSYKLHVSTGLTKNSLLTFLCPGVGGSRTYAIAFSFTVFYFLLKLPREALIPLSCSGILCQTVAISVLFRD